MVHAMSAIGPFPTRSTVLSPYLAIAEVVAKGLGSNRDPITLSRLDLVFSGSADSTCKYTYATRPRKLKNPIACAVG